MSHDQQDVQSFTDTNLQHKLYLSNWREFNCTINAITKINRSTALIKSDYKIIIRRLLVMVSEPVEFMKECGTILGTQMLCLSLGNNVNMLLSLSFALVNDLLIEVYN